MNLTMLSWLFLFFTSVCMFSDMQQLENLSDNEFSASKRIPTLSLVDVDTSVSRQIDASTSYNNSASANRNFIKLNSSNLKQHLTESEYFTAFGTQHVNNDDASVSVIYIPAKHLTKKRSRRSASRHLDFNTREEGHMGPPEESEHMSLHLHPSQPLLDPHFLFVQRWGNRTEHMKQDTWSDMTDGCFYRSMEAALSMCGGVRGVFYSKEKNIFYIHPLPDRFRDEEGSSPHIIVKRSSKVPKYSQSNYCSSHGRQEDNISTNHNKEHYVNHLNTLGNFTTNWKSRNHERVKRTPPSIMHVETAVFIDRELYQHMASNYPENTERELLRFVLAMINGVQLLYHDTSLGHPVNFLLKRLEILHEDPVGLQRPHDIDNFLSNFCGWQRIENPPDDSDPVHWDHALILTGLDLYVVSKQGKLSNQVVGLAPVGGMCTATSSCTVNEGRHFESVYVVAHEIGHNLGMRHDGPSADNECDPSSYIMSPTLGSGKITWSPCSRRYLQTFLDSSQSRCLLDHGSSAGPLDHSAEGALPGERFNADQQCMLKYGPGSGHSLMQPKEDICRDLHCQKERYTWTSHPALEGTHCGQSMWCRGGHCIPRGVAMHMQRVSGSPDSGEISNGAWSIWGQYSECASGCLFGQDGENGLDDGSTGVRMATRRCNNLRVEDGGRSCNGADRKYQTCFANQCRNVPRLTVQEFSDEICNRESNVDRDLTGKSVQIIARDAADACVVWCRKRNGGTKSRGWSLPDGTVCKNWNNASRSHILSYCINGRCEEFHCKHYDKHHKFILSSDMCPMMNDRIDNMDLNDRKSSFRTGSNKGKRGLSWLQNGGCHYNCIDGGSGIRMVMTKGKSKQSNVQLCQVNPKDCARILTPLEHATNICSNYKERVKRLSGLGMQISPTRDEPDRACRVACQDEHLPHRFYLVNGPPGWFPYGTDCSNGRHRQSTAYCISGKCLDFGSDGMPLADTSWLTSSARPSASIFMRIKRNVDSNILRRNSKYETRQGSLISDRPIFVPNV